MSVVCMQSHYHRPYPEEIGARVSICMSGFSSKDIFQGSLLDKMQILERSEVCSLLDTYENFFKLSFEFFGMSED